MRKGICVAGNLIVDITYPIERWPREGELTTVTDGIVSSTGGAVCNVIVDLAKLDGTLPLSALGVIGEDSEGDFILAELGKHGNIDLSLLKRRRERKTSFTAVMSDNQTKARTFFQYRGANSLFDESCIDWDTIDAELLHVGYILLLDALDEPDAEYGTMMAGLLAEAQQITGVRLRDAEEKLYPENMEAALRRMKELGVSTWAVIHCPEGGWGLDEKDGFVHVDSLKLPKDYIKGTVGAGDAFCAGVLYGAQKRKSLVESILLGTCAAAASLSCQGATEGLLSAEEVRKLGELYR